MTTKTLSKATLDRIRTASTSFLLADEGKGWIGARTGTYAGASSSLQVFDGDIPAEAVNALFGYNVLSTESQWTHLSADGVTLCTSKSRTIQYRDDTLQDLGNGKSGKAVHCPLEWTEPLDNAANVEGLRRMVVGVTGSGARSFLQYSGGIMLTKSGVEILPTLTFMTSVDGSLQSDFMRGGSLLICNNQTTGYGNKGIAKNIGADSRLRVRHTRHSDVKRALILPRLLDWQATADALAEEIDALAEVTVTDAQIDAFLDLYAPVAGKEKASLTRAENMRDAWSALYRNDARCSDWTGTAFGVLQTCNTYNSHVREIRGENADRLTRQADAYLTGGTTKSDHAAASMLERVLLAA